MSTAKSPKWILKAQARRIAATIKSAERGENIDTAFVQKIEEARHREVFKVGIVMDDKIVTIELPWTVIKTTKEAGLAEFIYNQMREKRNAIH